ELERWLRGEPILARPLGTLGRFRRWCQRNPVVAGLTGAVAALLGSGTGIATYFAVQAARRADAERVERHPAEGGEGHLEWALARGLVRPLDPRGGDILGQPEVEALWELAGTTNERLRRRFLEEAMRTEIGAAQLGNRAEAALIGAVGLNAQRRDL